ncbi:MAG: SUF system NifU family Fe-S cluster assembly protein [Armatimonadetes bacterium]|nr:MAG: SUF system NifU family Fe-S cluster assembly protein [Armatimonadota bacterium]GIV02633.1 MAG: iron-sulfur cluster assembly scaffold protein [Fimbriimonadales bacterium]
MDDLVRELYQEVILDHYRHPRNYGRVENDVRSVLGDNPLCGDRIEVFAKVEDGRLAEIRFEGSGCAISTASASLMTEHLKGKSVEEALAMIQAFHDMVTEGVKSERLGPLQVFEGVRDYPSRIKCAVLAWHALKAAILEQSETVTTEADE